jgi:hypothetical protein
MLEAAPVTELAPPPAMDQPLRRVVCVDLNGVLDRYRGWRDESHWDPPREGAREFLEALVREGFEVVVFTTRWAPDARRWLDAHGLLPFVREVTDRKPAAHVFVDDRAVCFRGDFARTLAEVVAFRAHWEERPGDG